MNKDNSIKEDILIKITADAILEIEKEIANASNGLDAIDELQHLKFIHSSLIKIKHIIEERNVHSIESFAPNIARIVIDTWPLNSQLGDKICEIEYLYEKLKLANEKR